MAKANNTLGNGTPIPLSAPSRLVYGGLGAMAPLIVSGISTDYAAVFSALTFVVALGYLAKAAVLFFIGGLVSFMYKNETEPWKCFVMGISAPALITTAAAGNARAAEFPPPAIIQRVQVVSPNFFKETFFEQLQRGFLSKNPSYTLVVVSKEDNLDRAKRVAAASWLFSACSSIAMTDPPFDSSHSPGTKSEDHVSRLIPLILSEGTSSDPPPPYYVLLGMPDDPRDFSFIDFLRRTIRIQFSTSFYGYEGYSGVRDIAKSGLYRPLDEATFSFLSTAIDASCRPLPPSNFRQ